MVTGGRKAPPGQKNGKTLGGALTGGGVANGKILKLKKFGEWGGKYGKAEQTADGKK